MREENHMEIQHYVFSLFLAALICGIAILCKVLFSDTKRQKKLLDEKETKILELYISVETLTEEFNDLARTTIEEMKEYEMRALSRSAVSELPSEFEKIEQVLDRLPKSVPLDAARIKVLGDVVERTNSMSGNEASYFAPMQPQQPIQQPLPKAPVVPPPQHQSISQQAPRQAAPLPTISNAVHQAYGAPAPKPFNPPKVDTGNAVFQKMFDDTVDTGPVNTVYAETNGVATQQSRSDIILSMSEAGKDDIQIASELGITRNEVALVLGLKR